MDQPNFGLSQKFLLHDLEDSNVKAYYEFMVDSAVVFGANKTVAEAELLDSLRFEMELAKVLTDLIIFSRKTGEEGVMQMLRDTDTALACIPSPVKTQKLDQPNFFIQ